MDEAYPLLAMNEKEKPRIYFEQLSWGVWVWLFVALICSSIYLAIWAPLGNFPALFVTLLAIAGFYFISLKMQTTTYIQDNVLYVNDAKIELQYVKSAKSLNQNEFKRAIGIECDPAAFLAINFWIKSGVKVVINDKNDPTPYWLISSKRSVELAELLN